MNIYYYQRSTDCFINRKAVLYSVTYSRKTGLECQGSQADTFENKYKPIQ